MSRSRRHTPIFGNARCASEKQDKRDANRRLRRVTRQQLTPRELTCTTVAAPDCTCSWRCDACRDEPYYDGWVDHDPRCEACESWRLEHFRYHGVDADVDAFRGYDVGANCVLPIVEDVSNVWTFGKDGKGWRQPSERDARYCPPPTSCYVPESYAERRARYERSMRK